MNKPTILFAIVGGIILLGMVLSIYGNQLIFEKLTQTEGTISPGQPITLTTELDPDVSAHGTFAYQIMNFNDNKIKVTITDPTGLQIFSEVLEKDKDQKSFETTSVGKYNLEIETISSDEIHIITVIGPELDQFTGFITFISMGFLAVGMGGMIAVGIYAIKSRKKSQFK